MSRKSFVISIDVPVIIMKKLYIDANSEAHAKREARKYINNSCDHVDYFEIDEPGDLDFQYNYDKSVIRDIIEDYDAYLKHRETI